MAAVEIDETELMAHRNVSATMAALLNNPKTRQTVLRAVKTVNPQAAIPEIDAAEAPLAQLAEVAKKVDDLRASIDKDAKDREAAKALDTMHREWDSGRAALRSDGYGEDAIKKIEDFMEKEGIRSHKIAAAAFERLNPQPIAIGAAPRFFGSTEVLDSGARKDNAFLTALFEGDTEGATNSMVAQTLTELRSGNGA